MDGQTTPANGDDILNESPVEIRGEVLDALIEACAPATLDAVRALDAQIAQLRLRMQAMIDGYCGAKGWDLQRCSVSLSLDTGLFTVLPVGG